MAARLTGFELLLELRRLDADELALPAAVLVEMLDLPLCEDCHRHHDSPPAGTASTATTSTSTTT